jgi:hypothetical protein
VATLSSEIRQAIASSRDGMDVDELVRRFGKRASRRQIEQCVSGLQFRRILVSQPLDDDARKRRYRLAPAVRHPRRSDIRFCPGDVVRTPSGREAEVIAPLSDALSLRYLDDGDGVTLRPGLLIFVRRPAVAA